MFENFSAYMRLLDPEQASAWPAKAVEGPNGFALENEISPTHDPHRDHPRFHALLRRIGLEG